MVLIIDDEEKLRNLLSRIIRSEGFDVAEAADCKTGLKKMEQHNIDAVLCDVKLPDGSGVELTQKIKAQFPLIEIILLTAYGNITDGVQAMKNGAFDYIVKGNDNEKIIPLLHRAIEKSQLQKRIKELEKKVGAKFSFDAVTGRSKGVLQAIEFANSPVPSWMRSNKACLLTVLPLSIPICIAQPLKEVCFLQLLLRKPSTK